MIIKNVIEFLCRFDSLEMRQDVETLLCNCEIRHIYVFLFYYFFYYHCVNRIDMVVYLLRLI